MSRPATIKGIRAEFVTALQAAPAESSKIAQDIPSDGVDEEYLFGGQVPEMEEWLDTRKAVDLFQKKLRVPNKLYGNAIKADRFEKQDDRAGFFSNRIRDLATSAKHLEDKLILGTLIDAAESATGSEGPAYDGLAFFSTAHLDPAAAFTTAQDNDLTSAAATGTVPTLAEFVTMVDTHTQKYMDFRDQTGRKFWWSFPKVGYLVIPPGQIKVATEFVKSSSVDSTNPAIVNAMQGAVIQWAIIVNRQTANTADRTITALPFPGRMPFFKQHRLVPQIQQSTGDRSGEVAPELFLNRYDMWGAHSRIGVGYGQWRSAILHTWT